MRRLDRGSRFRKRAGVGFLLGAVLAGFLAPEGAQACPVCFGDGETLAGFTVSWLFLMMMPFAIIGSIGGWVFWLYRRGQSGKRRDDARRLALGRRESEF
ncbi:MAG: hypothetical protein ACE5JS_09740 [Nitrospinota bacterium]